MTSSTFDSLEAVRTLESVGIERKHAEAIADQLRTAAGADLDQIATKLTAFRSEVRYVMGLLTVLILAVTGRLFGVL